MSSRKIKIVVSEPGKAPEIKEIDSDLSSMQEVVGGYVECISVNNNIDIWVNEEGLLMDLPFNRYIGSVPVVGTIFAASHNNDGDTLGLNPKQVEIAMQLFN